MKRLTPEVVMAFLFVCGSCSLLVGLDSLAYILFLSGSVIELWDALGKAK